MYIEKCIEKKKEVKKKEGLNGVGNASPAVCKNNSSNSLRYYRLNYKNETTTTINSNI